MFQSLLTLDADVMNFSDAIASSSISYEHPLDESKLLHMVDITIISKAYMMDRSFFEMFDAVVEENLMSLKTQLKNMVSRNVHGISSNFLQMPSSVLLRNWFRDQDGECLYANSRFQDELS